jgi:hypothetical protein
VVSIRIADGKIRSSPFSGKINELLPSTALELIKVEVPIASGESWRLVTPPLEFNASVGRAYEFRKIGKTYRWTGVSVLAP